MPYGILQVGDTARFYSNDIHKNLKLRWYKNKCIILMGGFILEHDIASSIFTGKHKRPLALLVMNGCTDMGNKVNEYLLHWTTQPEHDLLSTYPGHGKDTFLIDAETPRFGSGEGKGIIHSSVRGYDLYILCDVTNYSVTYPLYGTPVPMSPDDHFADLKRLIAAAGNKPHRITVVMPFLYEGRQHKRSARESLDCALALQELFNMGVYNIITFDAHDPRIQNAAPLNNFDSVMPTYQMLKAILRLNPDLQIDPEHMMIISPDVGAADRNIYYATLMGLDVGLFYKRRDYSQIVNGRNPIVAHEYLGANVAGKDIIVADDIIATGESMIDIAKELKKRKAKRIFLATTFGLFTGGLEKFDKAYEEGLFTQVFATNLTHFDEKLLARPWFTSVDLSKYIATLIATLYHEHSIARLLDPHDRIERILTNHRANLAEMGVPQQAEEEVHAPGS